MTYTNPNAVKALNAYVWKLLQVNLGWTLTDYRGIVPIIPTSQQPEILEIGKPFLVYGASQNPADFLYALKSGSVAYNVYATTVEDCNKITNLLADTFDRQDEAAADVNYYLEQTTTDNISFGTIRKTMVQEAAPADEEGGMYSALVMLSVKYTLLEDTLVTKFDFTP